MNNAELSPARGDDLLVMAGSLGSSLHVPVKVGDRQVLVSFWSKEKNAFPDAAVEFLTDTAKRVGQK